MRKAMKSPQGLKAVMSVLAEEEKSNKDFASAPCANTNNGDDAKSETEEADDSVLSSSLPATSVKLSSILEATKSKKKKDNK